MRIAALAAMLLVPAAARAQQSPSDSLTIDQAVRLALEYHPSLRVAQASVQSAEAGFTMAAAAYFPLITSSASLTRTEGAFVFNPDFPPRDQRYNNYTTGIQVQQTVFDFGRTINRVSASGSLLDAAEMDLRSTRQTVVANAQLAYYRLMQAQQLVAVDEEAVERLAHHLRQARAFYTVGKRAQVDVTKAEVDLANANVNLIRSRNRVKLTRLQLESAMGVHPPGAYAVGDTFAVELFPLSLDSVKAIALTQYPELRSARARANAGDALASAAWGAHLPTVSAFGTYTWSNFDFPLFSRWNAGLTLSLPLFQGFSIQAQADQARSAAEASRAVLDLLTDGISVEIEQTYFSLKEAEERIAATAKLVEQAGQGLTLAERQYAAGVASSLEVADAHLALSNARITRIQALFDYSTSLVNLRRLMGSPD